MGLDQWFVATPTRDHSRDGVDKIHEIPHVFEYRKDHRLADLMIRSKNGEWTWLAGAEDMACAVSTEMLDEWQDLIDGDGLPNDPDNVHDDDNVHHVWLRNHAYRRTIRWARYMIDNGWHVYYSQG